jgi:hypothetical protein
MNNELTVNDGIRIQTRDLAVWKKVLNEAAFAQLKTIATEHNSKAKTGYSIVRGQMLYEILMNKIAR